MALERDLSTLLSFRSSLSSIFLEFMEAVCADLFPPAPYFFSCVVELRLRVEGNEYTWTRMSKKSKEQNIFLHQLTN